MPSLHAHAAQRVQARYVRSGDGALRRLSVPLSYRDMLSDPNAPHWHAGCLREMTAQRECGTWDLVPAADVLSSGVRPLSCRWVFDAKIGDDYSVARWKARLVARWAFPNFR